MLLLYQRRFYGSLVGLLGRAKGEVLEGRPPPDFHFKEDRAERLGWIETARAGDRLVTLRFTVRLFEGKVWAVGVHADDFFFIVRQNEEGEPYLVAVAKRPADDRRLVNWIVEGEGRVRNLGVDF